MDSIQKRLIYFARKHLGKSYKYGASMGQAPRYFDCSSFVKYLYQRVKINLPRTALEQAHCGRAIKLDKEKLEIGDLLFFKGGWGRYDPDFPSGIGHVGIYVGNGKVINARWQQNQDGSDGGKVIEEPVESFVNRKDFTLVKRIL